MAESDLRRLSRAELLQMLIGQMEENEELRAQLEQAQAQLANRQIIIDNAGSIAEAALAVNGVFEAAQAAAQQYLDNIASMQARQESSFQEVQTEAQQRAALIIAEAQAYSAQVHAQADDYWRQVVERAAATLQNQDALRELVSQGMASMHKDEK